MTLLATKSEMKKYYKEKFKLLESQELLQGLYEYRKQIPCTKEYSDMLLRLEENISQLEINIQRSKESMEVNGSAIRETLKTVEDDIARIALLLHYYEGLSWDIIASILKTSAHAIKACAYRNMKRAGIQ